MVYGCIEHRTWAFLRNEGDFDINKTADGITNIIYQGLVIQKPASDPVSDALSRIEKAAARLERLAPAGDA
jgi:TetR/AcrR family transcriptional regulator, fatty acid metabolism regulator protein